MGRIVRYTGMDITEKDILDRIVRFDSRFIGTDSSGRYVLAELDDDDGITGQQAFTPEEYAEWGSIGVSERFFAMVDICAARIESGEPVGADTISSVLARARDMFLEQVQLTRKITGMWLDAAGRGTQNCHRSRHEREDRVD